MKEQRKRACAEPGGGLPHLRLEPSAEEAGKRLDRFLSEHCRERSRSQLKSYILRGRVLVNGKTAKPGYEIRPGDDIGLWIPPLEASDSLSPEPLPLEILYEDEDILVVSKAPGMVAHPGAGRDSGTLVHGLLAHCSRLAVQGAPLRPGIVHRLDRDTSGAMVVAKSDRAYLGLVEQFKARKVRKEYLAFVYGKLSSKEGTIRTRMDRHPKDRKKMAVCEAGGREAVSHWVELESWEVASLLRVRIETGRTHQIRVHLSHLRHPVVGDATYGGGKGRAKGIVSKALRDLLLSADRQMLHAHRLSFDHPVAGTLLDLTAPPPSDFARLWEGLRQRSS